MKKWVQHHQILAFFILVFAIAWAIWLPTIPSKLSDTVQYPFLLVSGFAPWVSAMIVLRISDGPAGLKAWVSRNFRFRIRPVWYLTGAFFIPWTLGGLDYGVYRLIGGQWTFLAHMPDAAYPFAVLLAAMFIGGNEEPGWRGFATPMLIRKYHPVTASCIVGFLWGIWHAPFYIPGMGGDADQSLVWFTIMTTGLAIIWTWAYYRFGSIIPVMLLHGGFNQFFGHLHRDPVAFHSISFGSQQTKALAIWLFALSIIMLTRGRLGVTEDASIETAAPVTESEGNGIGGKAMRPRRWGRGLLIILAVIWLVDLIGGLVMDRRTYHTRVADGAEPRIVHRPPATDLSWMHGKTKEIPLYDPAEPGDPWAMDLRSADLSAADAAGHEKDLVRASFDSKTKWPDGIEGMKDFRPDEFMELGKNPGLGVRALHKSGITGKGVGVAIIDYPLLVDHAEVKGRVRMYEEIHAGDQYAQMHGCAVSSIAVGKNVGVAPGADLYFVAMGNFHYSPLTRICDYVPGLGILAMADYKPVARAIDRIVEVSKHLPEDRKIRVISISQGFMGPRGWWAFRRSIRKAEKEGIFVITCALDNTSGGKMDYMGLGREPLLNPDSLASYGPGSLWSKAFYRNERWLAGRMLWVPIDSRCTASPTGNSDYVFYRTGGMSWAAPYIAGLYALACQVKPDVTPREFWDAALDTGDTVQVEKDGRKRQLGKIANPKKLIERLQES